MHFDMVHEIFKLPGGGGGGGGGAGGPPTWGDKSPAGVLLPSLAGESVRFSDCLRDFPLGSSRWQLQKQRAVSAPVYAFNLASDLACDGLRNSRADSSFDSSSVARWTSVSAVSHTTSDTGSFGSMRSRCCKIDRKGISCGVSTTWRRIAWNTSRCELKSTPSGPRFNWRLAVCPRKRVNPIACITQTKGLRVFNARALGTSQSMFIKNQRGLSLPWSCDSSLSFCSSKTSIWTLRSVSEAASFLRSFKMASSLRPTNSLRMRKRSFSCGVDMMMQFMKATKAVLYSSEVASRSSRTTTPNLYLSPSYIVISLPKLQWFFLIVSYLSKS